MLRKTWTRISIFTCSKFIFGKFSQNRGIMQHLVVNHPNLSENNPNKIYNSISHKLKLILSLDWKFPEIFHVGSGKLPELAYIGSQEFWMRASIQAWLCRILETWVPTVLIYIMRLNNKYIEVCLASLYDRTGQREETDIQPKMAEDIYTFQRYGSKLEVHMWLGSYVWHQWYVWHQLHIMFGIKQHVWNRVECRNCDASEMYQY